MVAQTRRENEAGHRAGLRIGRVRRRQSPPSPRRRSERREPRDRGVPSEQRESTKDNHGVLCRIQQSCTTSVVSAEDNTRYFLSHDGDGSRRRA